MSDTLPPVGAPSARVAGTQPSSTSLNLAVAKRSGPEQQRGGFDSLPDADRQVVERLLQNPAHRAAIARMLAAEPAVTAPPARKNLRRAQLGENPVPAGFVVTGLRIGGNSRAEPVIVDDQFLGRKVIDDPDPILVLTAQNGAAASRCLVVEAAAAPAGFAKVAECEVMLRDDEVQLGSARDGSPCATISPRSPLRTFIVCVPDGV
jgi:hypothetical protein